LKSKTKKICDLLHQVIRMIICINIGRAAQLRALIEF